MVRADALILRYLLRASQQRMVFWMRMQAIRSMSERSFSRCQVARSDLKSNSLLIIPLSRTGPSSDTSSLLHRTCCLLIVLKQLQQPINLKDICSDKVQNPELGLNQINARLVVVKLCGIIHSIYDWALTLWPYYLHDGVGGQDSLLNTGLIRGAADFGKLVAVVFTHQEITEGLVSGSERGRSGESSGCWRAALGRAVSGGDSL
ncbi:hypothetical protein EYF80_002830 [Liparis tanakae]|uniref:Uncharacterized protein n=1 Tax=Liparis tanakae TaxID=230148 RepID=A0A4Z2J9R1_9TELE|nr:hypothetical protein EYF80_002830 [Liparis tanakae]